MNIHSVHQQHRLSPLWLALLATLAFACLCNVTGVTPPATPTNAPAASNTPIPATQPSSPALSFTQNANCRSGPGTAFDIVDTIYQGQIVPIVSRNETNTWFQVKKPSGDGYCWVSIVSVVVQGDLNGVSIVSIENPTAKPVAKPDKTPTLPNWQGPLIQIATKAPKWQGPLIQIATTEVPKWQGPPIQIATKP